MSNPAELGLEAYLQAMGVAHERQAQDVAALQSSVDEVARVRELLGRLPDKVRHKAMVPFGKHAFFEGELVHTNEFLVGLGCELQLEASAKQAAEVLGRRQGRAEAALARAALQLRELEARVQDLTMSLTNESGEGFMEIRQDWDEAEQLLRDAAAAAAASSSAAASSKAAQGQGKEQGKAGSSGRGGKAASAAGADADDGEEARIFARLAELEWMEAEAGRAGEEEEEAAAEVEKKADGDKGEETDAAAGTGRAGAGRAGAGTSKPGAKGAAEPPATATAAAAVSASSGGGAGAGASASAEARGSVAAAGASGRDGVASGAAAPGKSAAAAAAATRGAAAPLRKGFLLGGGGGGAKVKAAASAVAAATSASASASAAAQPQDAGAGSGGSGSSSPSAGEARRRRRVSFADGSAPGEEGGGDADLLAAGPFARRSGSPSGDAAAASSSGGGAPVATGGLRPALKQGTSPGSMQQQQQQQPPSQPSAEEFWGPVAAGRGRGGPGLPAAAVFEESHCDAAMAMARAREQAFSGQVVERDSGSAGAVSGGLPAVGGLEVREGVVAHRAVDYGVPPEEPAPPKRVSKFKQQRAGL